MFRGGKMPRCFTKSALPGAGLVLPKSFTAATTRMKTKMRMYSHIPKSSVSFYDLIESIKNMIDHIFVFIQKNGGWLIIALMLVSVFATCLKKKQGKNDKHPNEAD